jgi:ankyrin repeat protein
MVSCIDRDEDVDLELINGYDFRIFQQTSAWELAKAVEDEDIELIKDIVTNTNVDINTTDPKYGNSLLMMSARRNKFESFKTLISLGANIDIHNDYDSISVIHIVCKNIRIKDQIKYLDILIEKGVDVNDRSNVKNINTPLLIECSNAYRGKSALKVVKYLVQNGANINYINEDNYFALRSSIVFNNYDVAIYLIKNGARYDIPFRLADGKIRNENDYIMDVLTSSYHKLDSKDYQEKMMLVDYLEKLGLKYKRKDTINKWDLETIKRWYPNSWEEYIKVY